MASTSAALVNGLGSAFLTGGKKSQALLSAPVAARAGGAVAPKRLLVVAAAPKKSWIPAVKGGGNLIDPEWLDGSPSILEMVQRGRTHPRRWAMAAVVGIFVGQAWSGIPRFKLVQPHRCGGALLLWHTPRTQLLLMGWVESKRWVDFFNPESQSVEWATPWSRTAENFANATGDQGYPGGKFFDPLGFAGTLKDGVYIPDDEKLERLKLAEIKHARIAMLAMLSGGCTLGLHWAGAQCNCVTTH
ncbi:hypothetical protein DH2020_011110 [Rehmannia glutinosa]|uniref:Chlorophyll a-b binding protein, chloroplastic n=1 Tax=Rehmannia glutinosa TaxID=99300 RepID=A0ABR0XCH3_REHGL